MELAIRGGVGLEKILNILSNPLSDIANFTAYIRTAIIMFEVCWGLWKTVLVSDATTSGTNTISRPQIPFSS